VWVESVDERLGDGLDEGRDGVEVAARPHLLLALLDGAEVWSDCVCGGHLVLLVVV
jgi:hypothetical protein